MFEKYLTKSGKLSCKQPQEVKNQWYQAKFQGVHNGKYDYSLMQYINTREQISIICPEHGQFSQSAQNHQSGRGCPQCQNAKVTKSLQQILLEFQQIHGDKYGYSEVVYKNQHTHIKILCKEHGIFKQSPHHHLKGIGCPKCQHQNQDTLYLLQCINTGLVKIGITNNTKRRKQEIGGRLTILAEFLVTNPRYLEAELHRRFSKERVTNTKVSNGKTEFFNLTDAQLSNLL